LSLGVKNVSGDSVVVDSSGDSVDEDSSGLVESVVFEVDFSVEELFRKSSKLSKKFYFNFIIIIIAYFNDQIKGNLNP
jgi:hypothetical protein